MQQICEEYPMIVNAPSLAHLLIGQDQSSLFSNINKKPAVSAKLVHDSLSSKEIEQRQKIASRGVIERQIDKFQNAVKKANSLDEALRDPSVHSVLNEIYEIKILSGNSDRFAKLATTDPEDKHSDVARSRDRGLIDLATDLKKSGNGLDFLANPEFLSKVKDHLVSIEFEEKARNMNPAAGDAFYFERKSADIKRGMDILANSVVRDVVFEALKIPDSYKSKPLETQIKKLNEKLDYSKFQDPKFVKEMSADFLNQKLIKQPSGKPSMLNILQSSGTGGLFNILS